MAWLGCSGSDYGSYTQKISCFITIHEYHWDVLTLPNVVIKCFVIIQIRSASGPAALLPHRVRSVIFLFIFFLIFIIIIIPVSAEWLYRFFTSWCGVSLSFCRWRRWAIIKTIAGLITERRCAACYTASSHANANPFAHCTFSPLFCAQPSISPTHSQSIVCAHLHRWP